MSLHLATDGIIQEIAEVLHVATLVLPCASSAVSSASAPNTSFIAACVGWDRTRMDGIQGARIWCGHGVFAHNLSKIGALLEAAHSKAA